MKILFLLLLIGCGASKLTAAAGETWVVKPLDHKYGPNEKNRLDRTEVYEVVASKVEVVITGYLARKSFIEISEQTAAAYTGHYYRCPPGKKPFLVRAVYAFGGTGSYMVVRHHDSVWVQHDSLGSAPMTINKSALVVNLDFVPNEAYATVSVIE
ncbi:MAG: hypothetical protein V4773_16725 [Verrucomicrobiota bacterium]